VPVSDREATRDPERDRRDGAQWLKSAIAYCNWRAGEPWRKTWRSDSERWAVSRWEYLDAARLLSDLLVAPAQVPARPQPVLPSLNTEPGYTPEEIELSTKPVKWLVDELMRADSRYTLRGTLMHLRRLKLARLLVRARSENSLQLERRRA
jgi:hypothetical protein